MKIKGIYHMPGSRFLWYRWTGSDGKQHATSLKTGDMAEAISAANKIKAGEAFARWERQDTIPTPATKIVEKYLNDAQARSRNAMRPRTVHRRRKVLTKFLRDAGIEDVRDITTAAVNRWLAGLKKAGRSAETLHSYAWAVKIFVEYLGNKLDGLEIPQKPAHGRKNWVRSEDANRVIAASTDPELTFILNCGFKAGLRKDEIINLKVGWFDLPSGLLHVQNDPAAGFELKDRDNRVVPLSRSFQEFLEGFLKGRDANEYCIAPGKVKGKNEYRYDFKNSYNSHLKKCDVKCAAHDMRRSFASNLVARGESIYKVARWIGDGVAVVERSYGHLAPGDRGIDVLD